MSFGDAVKLSDSLKGWDPQRLTNAAVVVIALGAVVFAGLTIMQDLKAIRADHQAQGNAMNLLAVVSDYQSCMYFARENPDRVESCYRNYALAREGWAKAAFSK